jgi:hypothetical protein
MTRSEDFDDYFLAANFREMPNITRTGDVSDEEFLYLTLEAGALCSLIVRTITFLR